MSGFPPGLLQQRQYPLGAPSSIGQRGVGKQKQGAGLKAVGAQRPAGSAAWERCVCCQPFPSIHVRFLILFFFFPPKVLATVTGAMKVNTLLLLLLFTYHPADAGPKPAMVNDYRAPVHTPPPLTLPSCLTLMLQWCLNQGTDVLKT